jgi:hypothetical protein
VENHQIPCDNVLQNPFCSYKSILRIIGYCKGKSKLCGCIRNYENSDMNQMVAWSSMQYTIFGILFYGFGFTETPIWKRGKWLFICCSYLFKIDAKSQKARSGYLQSKILLTEVVNLWHNPNPNPEQ